jgi:hypothetical protein
MKQRVEDRWRPGDEDLNRGDYRSDFGPEGRNRFAHPPDRDRPEHRESRHQQYRSREEREPMSDRDDRARMHAGGWRWRRAGNEGWQRGRESGGYGSQFDAWRSGVGSGPAGFGFGREEDPGRGGFVDHDWQPTRPARGRGAWAGDWSEEDYRGRGPRDYRRSDDRVREEICERLTEDRAVDATDIVVHVHDGEVTLSGAVPSRDQKRRAEECVEGVTGVRDVFNQLHVDRANAERRPWGAGSR